MNDEVRHPRLEVSVYQALAAAALLITLFFAPDLGRSFGLVDPETVESITIAMGMVLGLPALVVVPTALILSIIQLVVGPRSVRLRVTVWYVLGPGLFMLSVAVRDFEPQYSPYVGSADPGVTVGVVLTTAALLFSLVLPVVWLFRRRSANAPPSAVT